MRTTFLLAFILLNIGFIKAQPSFTVSVEEVNIENPVGVHSYSMAIDGQKVLILGGRTVGLHKRRPFEAFLEDENNKQLIVLDLENKKTYT